MQADVMLELRVLHVAGNRKSTEAKRRQSPPPRIRVSVRLELGLMGKVRG